MKIRLGIGGLLLAAAICPAGAARRPAARLGLSFARFFRKSNARSVMMSVTYPVCFLLPSSRSISGLKYAPCPGRTSQQSKPKAPGGVLRCHLPTTPVW